MDESETPAAAGARELREETGYRGEPAEPLGCIALNPSWQSSRVHVVLVRGARPAGAKETDPGEETRVRLLSPERARAMALAGELDAAPALAALALFEWREGARGA